jgi:predicted kinase
MTSPRVLVVVGPPGSGKSVLSEALVRELGDGWVVKHHDDWIHRPDPDLEGVAWYKARPKYAKRAGALVADHLEGGGVGFVFDGVLADQSEVDRLVGASAVDPKSGGVLVVSLRCRAEVAYERIKARDPDFVRRERCPSVEHYRRGFYDPYSPRGIRADLVIDTETDDQQAALRKVLQRVRPAGAPTHHEASGLSHNASV